MSFFNFFSSLTHPRPTQNGWVATHQLRTTAIEHLMDVVEREIHIMDLQATNLQQLRDAIMSIWTLQIYIYIYIFPLLSEGCWLHMFRSCWHVLNNVRMCAMKKLFGKNMKVLLCLSEQLKWHCWLQSFVIKLTEIYGALYLVLLLSINLFHSRMYHIL